MGLNLPEEIAHFIDGAPLIRDEIGESPSRVFGFARGNDRFYLN